MSHKENDKWFEGLFERLQEAQVSGRDNLFSANHRAAMIRQHGATQAQWITIEELCNA